MSQSAVDLVIRGLVGGDRIATEQDIINILDRMSTATFNLGRRNLPRPLQDLMRQHGHPVPSRGDDLTFHWAKHVLGDRQWTSATTPEEYFQHARNAVLHPESRLVVQNAALSRDVAIIIALTTDVVPEHHRGSRAGDEMLVVYSAFTGRILSAHMVESSSKLMAGPNTVWLRR